MLHIQKNQVMLSHYAWQLCGMSEAGLIPQTFSKRHARYGTPIHASMHRAACARRPGPDDEISFLESRL